jgi:hypothetical protein
VIAGHLRGCLARRMDFWSVQSVLFAAARRCEFRERAAARLIYFTQDEVDAFQSIREAIRKDQSWTGFDEACRTVTAKDRRIRDRCQRSFR